MNNPSRYEQKISVLTPKNHFKYTLLSRQYVPIFFKIKILFGLSDFACEFIIKGDLHAEQG